MSEDVRGTTLAMGLDDAAWPSSASEQVSKPSGVVVIDALPLLAEAVRESASVRVGPRGSQLTDPLILLIPG